MSLDADAEDNRETAITNFKSQGVTCVALSHLRVRDLHCQRCETMEKWARLQFHTPGFLKKLVRISQVFNWEEFTGHTNDTVVERAAKTVNIEPDVDGDHLPAHLRRNDDLRTREQRALSRRADPYPKGVDVEVVYQKAMLHRAVFRELGRHIGAYNFIRDGIREE